MDDELTFSAAAPCFRAGGTPCEGCDGWRLEITHDKANNPVCPITAEPPLRAAGDGSARTNTGTANCGQVLLAGYLF